MVDGNKLIMVDNASDYVDPAHDSMGHDYVTFKPCDETPGIGTIPKYYIE